MITNDTGWWDWVEDHYETTLTITRYDGKSEAPSGFIVNDKGQISAKVGIEGQEMPVADAPSVQQRRYFIIANLNQSEDSLKILSELTKGTILRVPNDIEDTLWSMSKHSSLDEGDFRVTRIQ